ncbi:E3 ubiquitin-protein ligase SH3RF2 isoform X1 [Bufo gargarizans]|uniref:E3 ubiquitin-protein ligase SH3RF2 isoform X1 n=1 Tax=Bufo gargarizans TaxID=30331 RepID=UPI001CF575A3|nr:E3 ubiquitin-protein ligase SH3RF2 isoform X1 [Bufo gargarizans]XP_044136685.1 E3 ubiquitin-protein ligase SH3RF2 isoform X1 [Bufo gargarizans]
MDELVVLDLLNCPVCLGKLDATAKVLPCQHTFCQPCLQRILKARKELKCPECRTLVNGTIEELPANLLLVRLLEGLKNGQSLVRKNSFQRVGGLSSTSDSFRKGPEQKTNHESQNRLFPKTRMPIEGVSCAKAVSSYRGQNRSNLSFNKGDIIILHRQLDDHWYHGEVNGETGIVPARSVKILQKIDQPPALCKALYNFESKDNGKGENKNCLKFAKDDIISVIRRVDDNWAEGKMGDQVGVFPLLFVELNSTAKQLLESNKSRKKDVKNLPFTSPLRKSPSNVKSSEPETMQRIPDRRRKTPRQFLITNALNTLNRIVHFPSGRQTPEISTPILISSSNTAIIEKARYLPSSPNQINGSFFYATLGPQGTGPSLVAFPSSHQNILANMCVAVYPYTAQGPEEIDLQKGEGVRVLGKIQEGWLRGVSLVTGKSGFFPSHCVNPVYRKYSKYPEPRLPSHQSNWISSNASVSSQSSVSETGISKPVRSFFVPTAVVEPLKKNSPSSSAVVPTLRRRNDSFKKSMPPQKNVQNNTTTQAVTTFSRPSSGIVQPQQLFINAAYSQVGASADIRLRPSSLCDVLPISGRPVDYRRYSAASSISFEPKEFPMKIDSPAKPLSTAPPSILVKPDTPKNSSDKQVKTVRFMTFSPPTLKRQSVYLDDKLEQLSSQPPTPTTPENSSTSDALVTVSLRPNPSLAQLAEGRKVQKLRNITPQSTLSFPNKKAISDNSNRLTAIHQTQDMLST